jgi:signal transduction histidine kinase
MRPDLRRTRRTLTLRYGAFVSLLLLVFALGVYAQVRRARRELLHQEVEQLAAMAAAHLPLIHHEYDEMRHPGPRLHAPVPLITAFSGVEIQPAHRRIRWYDPQLRQLASIGSFRATGAMIPPLANRGQSQWQPLEQGVALWRPVASDDQAGGAAALQGYVSVALNADMAEAELARLRQGLAIGGLLAGLVAFLASGWLVEASLAPVRRQIERLIRFSADASHELRHPLTAVRALIGSLRHGGLLDTCPAGVPDKLALIDQATGRMGVLLDDLLLLTRSDRAIDDRSAMRPFPLEELVDDLVALHQEQARSLGVTLRCDIHDSAPVLGHPERLRRLLENLLANALRFSPQGGTVTLGLAVARSRVELWVDDEGPGIPEAQRRQVFERFWQADPSRSEAEHHGLGLSIAQAIAQAHRGRLTTLEAPGGGARLLLELPTAG